MCLINRNYKNAPNIKILQRCVSLAALMFKVVFSFATAKEDLRLKMSLHCYSILLYDTGIYINTLATYLL